MTVKFKARVRDYMFRAMMANLIYKAACFAITMFVVFAIGWYAASQYTMNTLKVWYQPTTDTIQVMDYMGNIQGHYFNAE